MRALVGSRRFRWSGWLRNEGAEATVLDPLASGLPGFARETRSGRTYLLGVADAWRAPERLFSAARRLRGDLWLLPPPPETPVGRDAFDELLSALTPHEVLAPTDAPDWVPGTRTELEPEVPARVRETSAAAAWRDVLDRGRDHAVPLADARWEGLALGWGEIVPSDRLPDALRLEKTGRTLWIFADHDPAPGKIAYATERAHAATARVVDPRVYEGRIVAVTNDAGEEIGHGRIVAADLAAGAMRLRTTVVPPWRSPRIRVGWMRVDADGHALGEGKRYTD